MCGGRGAQDLQPPSRHSAGRGLVLRVHRPQPAHQWQQLCKHAWQGRQRARGLGTSAWPAMGLAGLCTTRFGGQNPLHKLLFQPRIPLPTPPVPPPHLLCIHAQAHPHPIPALILLPQRPLASGGQASGKCFANYSQIEQFEASLSLRSTPGKASMCWHHPPAAVNDMFWYNSRHSSPSLPLRPRPAPLCCSSFPWQCWSPSGVASAQ